jgi:sigma-E factor negative regulatory protein RseB
MHRNNRLDVVRMRGLLFAVLLVVTGVALAEGLTAMDWIQKMSGAMQGLSYKGRFVYLQDNNLESMSITHINGAEGVRERLLSLNGEAREILRDNNNLTCIWPSSRQVVVDRSSQSTSSPLWVPEDVEQLSRHYRFSVIGKDRVADQSSIIVSIMPKDKLRYGMKVWINEDNGLMLKSLVVDGDHQTLEQIMFTQMEKVDSDSELTFSVLPKINDGYALIRSHNGVQASQIAADTRWQLKSLPQGFRIESAFRKKMPDSDTFIQQMVLSDGMASVSIFIEPTSADSLTGETSMGAINAYGTRLNEFTVTAIGEVPAATVQQMAKAVVYQN